MNNVILDEKSSIKTAIVVVPDRQLSLAIGKEGQNARLAAKLTGWRIDIKSETEAKAEGIDQLVFERAQREVMGKADDILSVAERILLSDNKPTESDRLWQVAQSLGEEGATPELAESLGGPSLEDALAKLAEQQHREAESLPELPGVDELDKKPKTEERSVQDAWSAALAAAADTMPPLSRREVEPEPEPEEILPEPVIEEEPTVPNAPTPDEEPETIRMDNLTAPDELPDVITADMLRARMAQRKKETIFDDDFEIPAELLVGIDDDEEEGEIWDLDEEQGKSKKTKTKKAAPVKADKRPKKKKRRPQQDDDDAGSYF
ncbi:MAG: hypothetical protein R2867_22495 [Caldilineaceae bacterium]